MLEKRGMRMCQSYHSFVASFTSVNPFQLAHFTEVMLVKLEDILAERDGREKIQFSQQDIKHALIDVMRVLSIEVAEASIVEAQSQLQQTQLVTYALVR
jgi:hypothetical protein